MASIYTTFITTYFQDLGGFGSITDAFHCSTLLQFTALPSSFWDRLDHVHTWKGILETKWKCAFEVTIVFLKGFQEDSSSPPPKMTNVDQSNESRLLGFEGAGTDIVPIHPACKLSWRVVQGKDGWSLCCECLWGFVLMSEPTIHRYFPSVWLSTEQQL
jgi:hypothetical protein